MKYKYLPVYNVNNPAFQICFIILEENYFFGDVIEVGRAIKVY